MNLKHLTDHEVLSRTKQLTRDERQILTQILHHLKEVDQRKLFCDLGYQSLFDYTVNELKYSEGQAGRRIQAMRLLKEIPQMEEKIKSGALSLSNISQAQSFFREQKKTLGHSPLKPQEKINILEGLENKSAREGQRQLARLDPTMNLPKERERELTEAHLEMRFVFTTELKEKLEELRSLMGIQGTLMNFSELLEAMTDMSLEALKIKKFGKKRVNGSLKDSTINGDSIVQEKREQEQTNECLTSLKNSKCHRKDTSTAATPTPTPTPTAATPTSESTFEKKLDFKYKESPLNRCSQIKTDPREEREAFLKNQQRARRTLESKPYRHISKEIQFQVWQRDRGQCQLCFGQKNLNIDHIHPVALGGQSQTENLRLLCFHCNQRQAIKIFGRRMRRTRQIRN